MTRAEKYRCEFNRLEKILKRKDGASDEKSLRSVVESLARKRGNRVVQQYKEEIIQHIQLRNAIVHQSTNMTIVEPHEETISELRKLREHIERPKTAWDIATKPLVTIALDDDLSHAIRCMVEKCITSLPIIADKEVVGFVSERTIVRAINSAFEIGGAFVDEAKIRTLGVICRTEMILIRMVMFPEIQLFMRLKICLVTQLRTRGVFWRFSYLKMALSRLCRLGLSRPGICIKLISKKSKLDRAVATIGWD